MSDILDTRNPKLRIWICLALVLTTFALFWPVHRHEFLNYDDPVFITENPHVATGFTADNIRWAFSSEPKFYWRPLAWLSFMLDCQLFGLNPGAHHLSSLAFHLANTVLLFLVLSRMTGALWRSGLVAALFAWHPLHVEPVVWTADRVDLLSSLFWLLTLWAYFRHASARLSSVTKIQILNINYFLALVFFACGLMSKVTIVTLPFVLLLLDYWPLQRFDLNLKSNLKSFLNCVWEKVPFGLLAAIIGVISYRAQKSSGVIASADTLSIGLRTANAAISYLRYLGRTLWPEGLAPFYPHRAQWGFWPIVGAVVFLLLMTAWTFHQRRSRPYLLMGWLFFFGTLIPVIGLIQVGEYSTADRYTYIPLIGLFIMVAWGLFDLARRWPPLKSVIISALALSLVALGITARQQVDHWKTSKALWTRTKNVTRNNHIACNSLGTALEHEGNIAEAIKNYSEAISIKPGHGEAHFNLARVLIEQGKLDEAASCMKTLLKFGPGQPRAHYFLGLVSEGKGNREEAMREYIRALEIDPKYPEARNNLGCLLVEIGKHEEAISQFQETVKSNPDFLDALKNLGGTLVGRGRAQEALPILAKVVQLEPNHAETHYQIAMILSVGKNMEPAIAHYKEAIRLKPDWFEPLNNLAWILATHPDEKFRNGKLAVELAERACVLTKSKHAGALNTLAAAYAEARRFPAAISTAKIALEMAEASNETEMAAQIRACLELYRVEKPFRQ